MTQPRTLPSALEIAAACLGFTLFLGALTPAGSSAPTPADVDVLRLYDGFEGPFPGVNWTVGDSNSYNGSDYWGSSTYRAAAGNSSAYAAQVGNRSYSVNAMTEDWEGNWSANWTIAYNTGSIYGADYWGPSNYRVNTGAWSMWCAQVGYNNVTGGGNNSDIHKYDDQMNTTITRNINVTGLTDVTLDYSYWVIGEQSGMPITYYDALAVSYFAGRWYYTDTHAASSNGWQTSSVSIPSTTTKVAFLWYSDDGQEFEGAYIDDISVHGTRTDLNNISHTYDDGENATMYRGVDVSAYASARMDYRYWLDTASPNDSLEVMYNVGGNWTYADKHSGSSGGWQLSTVAIPVNTTLIGFRFISDLAGAREGAYIDEVRVWGTALSVVCSANVTVRSGYEVLTPFPFSGGGALGLPPYSWSWTFGDGSNSSLQNPTHSYQNPGNYTASLTVRDSLSQVCSVIAPTVSVVHDTTNVSVTPLSVDVTEGQSFQLYGTDGQGHPYDLNWTFAPPACGALDNATGPLVTFTTATTAGGSTCSVNGAIGSVSQSMTVHVLYDLTQVTIDPPSGAVVEGKSLLISATTRYGHALDFNWSTSCGRLSTVSGPSTTFTAVAAGGAVCTVTTSIAAAISSIDVAVLHDTSTITVTPAGASIYEGATQSFSAVDAFGLAFDASWAVTPAPCGSFTTAVGPSTTFTASTQAGGQNCTVQVSFASDSASVNLRVNHDTRTLSLAPLSANVEEGGTQGFGVVDAYGHGFAVAWSVAPSSCGEISPASGTNATLTASPDAGGSQCTVSATGPSGNPLQAIVSVHHGPAAAVRVSPSAPEADAGGAVLLSGAVEDGRGHALSGLTLAWSTTCGSLSAASGASVSLTLPADAAGSNCAVTARYDTFSATSTVTVAFAGPFTVTVTPADPTVAPGASQVLSAKVTDKFGHDVPNATVAWASTCGGLSSAQGPTTTFTAPSSGGGACAVTASTAMGSTANVPGAITVSSPSSSVLPIVAVAGAAAAGVALLLVMRRRRGAADAVPPEGVRLDQASRAPDVVVHAPPPQAAVLPPVAPPPGTPTGLGSKAAAPSAAKPLAKATPPPAKPSAPPAPKPPAKPAAPATPAKPPAPPAAPKTAPPPPAAKAPAPPAVAKPAAPPAAAVPVAPIAPPPAATEPGPGEFPPMPCPQCGKPVEVGWAACPECGLDLVWQ